MNSDYFDWRLYKTALINDANLGRYCGKGKYVITRERVDVLSPLSFDSTTEHPSKGSWKIRYAVERCGRKSLYNAVFKARKDDTPTANPGYPGETLADKVLAGNLARAVRGNAAVFLKGSCRQYANIVDTKLNPTKGHPDNNGGRLAVDWGELWTANACGQLLEFDVLLKPSKTGGTDYFVSKNPLKSTEQSPWIIKNKNGDPAAAVEAINLIKNGQKKEGFQKLEELAEKGNPAALFTLSKVLTDGNKTDKELSQGVFLALWAAYQRYAPAMHLVGKMNEEGKWFEKDLGAAYNWYLAAARSGDRIAVQDANRLAQKMRTR